MATKISDLFDNIHTIPQVPNVVRDIIAQLNDPDIDMHDIAKNVEQEATISLKVLRLVNSAHYGLSRKVSTINEALTFLGMSELKTLVLASGLVSSMPEVEGLDIQKFWENSFLKSQYARELAAEAGEDADLAFTAAMISNIGTILIFLGNPKAGLEIEQRLKAGDTRRYEYEERRLGFTSAQVSAELSRRWKFPSELVDVVEQSATPMEYSPTLKLAVILNIADYVSIHKQALSEEELLESLPVWLATFMGLTEEGLKEKVVALIGEESRLSGLAA